MHIGTHNQLKAHNEMLTAWRVLAAAACLCVSHCFTLHHGVLVNKASFSTRVRAAFVMFHSPCEAVDLTAESELSDV